MHRSHYASEIQAELIGETVRVAGWVHRRRDHGGIIFLDLRDRTGLVQIVVEPDRPAIFARADRVRAEYVIAVRGRVRPRPEGMANPALASGAVEIEPEAFEVLAEAKTPPFAPDDSAEAVDELVRLKYRYLDLRRPTLARNLHLRDRAIWAIRQYYHQAGFLEVETPALARSTPEGARDFLVPSRLAPGEFYALPQSPQIFKQLLMVAGLDRYYQIAKVFRDEDLRADRQPEFTQVDVEMSFVDVEDVLQSTEAMLRAVFREVLAIDLPPFPRLTWETAMEQYGSDKPDLRAGPPLVNLTAAARGVPFPVLATAEAVYGVRIGDYAPSRRELEEWSAAATELGAAGLLWLQSTSAGIRANTRALGESGGTALARAAGLEPGDLLLVVADGLAPARRIAGQLRLRAAETLGRTGDGFHFLWVTDFPLFEWSEEEQRYVAAHHPFTMPRASDLPRLSDDPASVRAEAYDVVLNGVELASGSIRIHRPELQQAVFERLGLSAREVREQFGFLLDAFQFGAPPHGGIAIGLDRLVMMMAGAKNLREVIAFPKTARGTDPLLGAPAPVDRAQLEDLGIMVARPVKTP